MMSELAGAWPDAVDDVLGGDQAVILAVVTPAAGVILSPVTNFGIRDRMRGTVTVNSSIGAWRKLELIGRNPHIALAYHTRRHGFSTRPEFVLVQGTASLAPPDPDYPDTIGQNWERFLGRRARGPLWDPWLRVYHTRVAIELAVERVVVWPTGDCRGPAETFGAAMPTSPPEPQRAPARGTDSRIDHARAARKAARLPDVLLGWVGADLFPVVTPVTVADTSPTGIVLAVPKGIEIPGNRRAGLTAHTFTRHVLGQTQQAYTGWLRDHPGESRVHYAPHTRAGYRLPPSRLLYKLAVGLQTRRWHRRATTGGQ